MASAGPVGVDRAEQAAAGVARSGQLVRLGTAHLADHQHVGPHAQALLHQLAQADLGLALGADPDLAGLVVVAVESGADSSRVTSQPSTR